jgi:hypothetical protein
MYSVTLWLLFTLPCLTWWWPYRKGPKRVIIYLTPYTIINFVVFDLYTLYHLWYLWLHKTGMNHLKIPQVPAWGWLQFYAITARRRKFSIHFPFPGKYNFLCHFFFFGNETSSFTLVQYMAWGWGKVCWGKVWWGKTFGVKVYKGTGGYRELQSEELYTQYWEEHVARKKGRRNT